MITVWIQIKAKQGKAAELKTVLLKAINKSKDLLRYEIFRQAADESRFSILETFASQEAIDFHYLTQEYIAWRKIVDELIEEGHGTDYDVLYSSVT